MAGRSLLWAIRYRTVVLYNTNCIKHKNTALFSTICIIHFHRHDTRFNIPTCDILCQTEVDSAISNLCIPIIYHIYRQDIVAYDLYDFILVESMTAFLQTTLYVLILFLHNPERTEAQPNCTLACKNGGLCQIVRGSEGDEELCECLDGFVGSLCETMYDNSSSSDPNCTLSCEKGGRCEMLATDEGLMMHCVCESLDGVPCMYKTTSNNSTGDSSCTLACENGGVCQVGRNGIDGSICLCQAGFVGFL